jgi:hypothetical protein
MNVNIRNQTVELRGPESRSGPRPKASCPDRPVGSSCRLEARVALEEVLRRFPEWEVDWDNARQARTSTVRGWESLPVVVPS